MRLTEAEIERRVAESYEVPNRVLEAVPEPLVTVRTSTYNHGPFIRQCIESVLMQKTDFPFEYIIGEDCSTDETRAIVLELANEYPEIIRVITSDQNIGSKGNGRRCIRASRGKYMALCEGDDYWTDPRKLQKQVDILEANPDVVLCHHWQSLCVQDDRGKWVEVDAPKDGHGYWPVARSSVKDIFSNHVRCKTRTNVARNIFKNMDLPSWLTDCKFGDVPQSFILGQFGDFYFIDEPMAAYRQTGTGLSMQGSHRKDFIRKHYEEWVKIWDYGVRHYHYKYALEARETAKEFYQKIFGEIRFWDVASISSIFYERLFTRGFCWKYDGWLLLQMMCLAVRSRVEQLNRFLSRSFRRFKHA